jgi:hypothetical protein
MLTTIATVLAGLVGLFGLFLAANVFRSPAAAAGFGIPGTPVTDHTFQAWLRVKAVRDLATGLLVLVALVAGPPDLLGWLILTAAVIPVGDALIVLRSNGSRATAFGVHGATAAAMIAVGALLLVG